MNETVIQFEKFHQLQENDCQQKIIDAKSKLKDKLVILGHHYQNESVYRHADFTGDSLKLAQYTQNLEAQY